MSFTSIVKNEVSKLEIEEIEKISELSALLKNTSVITNTIKITTENASVARRIFTLLKNLFNINSKITVRRGYNFNKNYIYILEITKNIEKIKQELSLNKEIPERYIYDEDELKRTYLRGVFLGSGSINDPKKSRYHLEILVETEEYANFISSLLNDFRLNSKVLKRENKYMIYVKEAEKISDFLRIIKAINAVFYYEDIRIYRDHKNMTNRLNNCEQANVDKIIETANNQLKDIEIIENYDALDLLDEKTKETINYRKKYPEVSLTELSEIISIETGKEITKSGIYHRMNKVKALAKKIKEKNN
ncbi:MAG: DNA-binding protein WhiA [Lactobacillales bacterium]|nr:DNA-binding protein WhiA [Lactobacillales bacterium]